jgi:pSer/pThr/pTyr-binding forkhead associated (FHA) protein
VGSLLRIVVDHVAGSRRGQRQEFELCDRLRFGRHPDNEITFDAHRDLDASSRHAELRRNADGFVLHDVGSSNGTWVGDARVAELRIEVGHPVVVEFGAGGPRARLFIGDAEAVAALPEIEATMAGRAAPRRRWPLYVAAGALLAALIAVIWWQLGG